ncbi:hypothetical protein OS188_01970 [Xanthomarina sp. F1114]|uniref:hypothetical protein n=1 Tax=Xanthomarina sp. F1114 TaxID=2996019 RepID=UPI00225DDE26|nr:hypothetical protein [Xanthomarina sp. F1114]MCX7546714.1 hypothetical protein [Xanthomarina sp. F1114]
MSIFLAKFWGWYLILFFVVLSFNPRRIKQIFKDLHDEKFLIVTSSIAVIVGLLNILIHNVWEFSWKLIPTLIGWFALFEGAALFTFPRQTVTRLNYINVKYVQVIYMLLFLVGIFLLNIAYNIVPY